LSSWEDAYKTAPPWDVGRPQPVFVELAQKGELKKGSVLDVGCGTGENALYFAQNGFSVTGIDLSSRAIAAAKTKAAERKLKVDFRVGNALSLDFKDCKAFDNIVDSGLFHTFTDHDRPIYAREIARVLVSSGRYFMLCFSVDEPIGWGGPRRVSREEIEATFSPLFKINYIRDALFATRFHNNGGKAFLTSATRKRDQTILAPGVVKVYDSILVGLRSEKFQLADTARVLEQRFSFAENYGIDIKPEFVDQVLTHES
jgi:SAM-dependent methyltransferase